MGRAHIPKGERQAVCGALASLACHSPSLQPRWGTAEGDLGAHPPALPSEALPEVVPPPPSRCIGGGGIDRWTAGGAGSVIYARFGWQTRGTRGVRAGVRWRPAAAVRVAPAPGGPCIDTARRCTFTERPRGGPQPHPPLDQKATLTVRGGCRPLPSVAWADGIAPPRLTAAGLRFDGGPSAECGGPHPRSLPLWVDPGCALWACLVSVSGFVWTAMPVWHPAPCKP